MKKARFDALNAAIIALVGVLLLLGILSSLGINQPFITGGEMLVQNFEIHYPTIPIWGWAIFVPWAVFAVKYFIGLYRYNSTHCKDLKKSVDTRVLVYIGILEYLLFAKFHLGPYYGTILGIFITMITVTFIGVIFAVNVTIFFAIIGATVVETAVGAFHIFFLTPSPGLAIIAIPMLFTGFIIINTMLTTVLPMIIAVSECLFSKNFWLSICTFIKNFSQFQSEEQQKNA